MYTIPCRREIYNNSVDNEQRSRVQNKSWVSKSTVKRECQPHRRKWQALRVNLNFVTEALPGKVSRFRESGHRLAPRLTRRCHNRPTLESATEQNNRSSYLQNAFPMTLIIAILVSCFLRVVFRISLSQNIYQVFRLPFSLESPFSFITGDHS